jgi:hypothetical protein
MNLSIVANKTKLEANPKSYSNVSVVLKDIYNNTVFTDNQSDISVKVLDEYNDIITIKKQKVKLRK